MDIDAIQGMIERADRVGLIETATRQKRSLEKQRDRLLQLAPDTTLRQMVRLCRQAEQSEGNDQTLEMIEAEMRRRGLNVLRLVR